MSFWQALWDIFETVPTFITNYLILSTITTFLIGYNGQNRTSKLLCKAGASSSSSSSSHHHHNMTLKSSSPLSHRTHIISISIVIIINSSLSSISSIWECIKWTFPLQKLFGRPILAIVTNRKSGDSWQNKISYKSGHGFKNVPYSLSKWHPPFEN